MQLDNLSRMKGGWFLGNFQPSLYQTPLVEVAVKSHWSGEHWPAHYQHIATEYNALLSGTMRMNGQLLKSGALFTFLPGEVATPEFLTDCTLVVVKIPSLPGDKVVVR